MSVMAAASRTVPAGPIGHFLLGNLLDISRDQLGFLLDCARTYGDRVELRFGRRRIVVLNSPRDVEEVLVNQQRNFKKGYFYRVLAPLLGNGLLSSEGDFWLRQRRLAQPAFHRDRISAYGSIMVRHTERMLAGWQAGTVRDIHADMTQLTLEIIAKTLFDADVHGEARDAGTALSDAQESFLARF